MSTERLLQLGDVVRGGNQYGDKPKRGIVVFSNGEGFWRFSWGHKPTTNDQAVVQYSSGCWRFTDSASNLWRVLPRGDYNVRERIHSTILRWSEGKIEEQEHRRCEWRVMLEFLPISEQQLILAGPPVGMAQLALWVAKWVDPEGLTVLPRVARAIADWRPDEYGAQESDHETLAWTIWAAFLPPATEEDIFLGNWPDFYELAMLAANEAHIQHRRLAILKKNKERIAS